MYGAATSLDRVLLDLEFKYCKEVGSGLKNLELKFSAETFFFGNPR